VSWEEAEEEWKIFLENVTRARVALGCSKSNAWFRGHANSREYRLLLHLLRRPDRPDSDLKDKNARHLLRYTGEREAFIEYGFRRGGRISSWEQLAEMQHHGIPTRMLDWTENLSIALYFAVEHFLVQQKKFWNSAKHSQLEHKRYRCRFYYPSRSLPMPSVWVLNPYRLSEFSTKKTTVWDFTVDPEFDYYQRYLKHQNWEYSSPAPMFSPWRSSRIAAQNGMFTVWGGDKRALDEIVGSRIVKEIPLSRKAAVYACWQLVNVFCIDAYQLFRDLDTLSAKLKNEFLPKH